MPMTDPAAHSLPPHARIWPAFGAALTLETVAIAGLLAWAALQPHPPVLKPLAIEVAAPDPVPRPEPPTPPKPAVPPSPSPVPPQARPLPVAASPSPVPRAAPQPPVSPAPSEVAAPAVPAPAAAPAVAAAPPPPAGPVGPSSEYIAKVRAAVQAAFVYPAAAVAADFHGRTRVAFRLRDATVSAARVLVGSGMGLVDRAALQAVQAAHYPAAPAEMQGREHEYEVWVEFRP